MPLLQSLGVGIGRCKSMLRSHRGYSGLFAGMLQARPR